MTDNTLTMTRKDYMSAPYTTKEDATARHRAYYAQFVSEGLINAVVGRIGAQKLLDSVNRDGCFNDIPLAQWDRMQSLVLSYCGKKLSEANGTGGTSLSDTVCVAKEAARTWRERTEAAKQGE